MTPNMKPWRTVRAVAFVAIALLNTVAALQGQSRDLKAVDKVDKVGRLTPSGSLRIAFDPSGMDVSGWSNGFYTLIANDTTSTPVVYRFDSGGRLLQPTRVTILRWSR